MIVLFVGSNPSNSSETDTAFHGSTRSSKILTEWCSHIEGAMFVHINVLSSKTPNNRPLSRKEILSSLESLQENLRGIKPDKIVALGKTASAALTLLHVDFFEMPHPSGRNRLLNDKDYMAKKLINLKRYANKST
jgi:uracil-DNA glycosylase